jgi:hypothetical protein
MSVHRFGIAEALMYTPPRLYGREGAKQCKVVRLLSTDGDDPQYRVKCAAETFDRVVWESQLNDQILVRT